MSEKLAYTISEFTRLAGIGRSFLYEEVKAGRLTVHKAGRRTLITREDAENWLSRLPVGGNRCQHNAHGRSD